MLETLPDKILGIIVHLGEFYPLLCCPLHGSDPQDGLIKRWRTQLIFNLIFHHLQKTWLHINQFFPEWECCVHPVIRMHWVLLIHEEKCSFPSRGKKCSDPGCENFCQSFFCNRMMHCLANCFQMICTLVDCSNCRPSLKSQMSDFWLKACEYKRSEATNQHWSCRKRKAGNAT